MNRLNHALLPIVLLCLVPALASAQVAQVFQGGGSYSVQCPLATLRHPGQTSLGANSSGTVVTPHPESAEAPYTGPYTRTVTASPDGHTLSPLTLVDDGGAIKCQQISGGDGYMTEADGNQMFMFSFGPLSGLNAIENGQPGTQFPVHFDKPYCDPARPNYNSGQPNPNHGASGCNPGTDPNGAVGYNPPSTDPTVLATVNVDPGAIMNTGVMNGNIPGPLFAFDEDDEFLLTLSNVGMIMRPDLFEQHTVHFHGYPNASSFYDGVPEPSWAINIGASATYYYIAPDAGTYFWHCHITPPEHLQMGMVGWLYVRPRQNRVPAGTDLFQAKAAAPGAPVAYGNGVTGQSQEADLRTACDPALPNTTNYPGTTTANLRGPDILCSAPNPPADNHVLQGTYGVSDPFSRPDPEGYVATDNFKYVYNDGDGSTRYDIDVPIQIHGFDPNFHFVAMTFNPEGFADMKDKYFLLNGRSYPDTVGLPAGSAPGWTGGVPTSGTVNPIPATHAIYTTDSDSQQRPSQPAPLLIVLYNGTTTNIGTPHTCGAAPFSSGTAQCGQRAALRINDLDVVEYQTLATDGIPMELVGFNAKILRDQAGNDLFIKSNSITLGGGESLDVII
ncbi:MAG: multicopper oxidase domain-containing protein, partial [Steroidobacteraceae bacterium]